MTEAPKPIRLDKWLWAARFFKSRSLAAQAVTGGKVRQGGQRLKSAHLVKPGDVLTIGCEQGRFVVTVLALAGVRRPAIEARLLYEESADSIEARKEEREQRQLAGVGLHPPDRRPNKRDRRKIKAFIRNDEHEHN